MEESLISHLRLSSTMRKTVTVPLNDIAKEIIARYKDYPGDELLPFTFPQEYNRYIKSALQEAKITRLVTVLDPLTRTQKKGANQHNRSQPHGTTQFRRQPIQTSKRPQPNWLTYRPHRRKPRFCTISKNR